MMSMTEASATQKILHLAAENIAELKRFGCTESQLVIITELGQSIRLADLLDAGQTLADKSSKVLMAGLDGDRWIELIQRTIPGARS